jgi:hypothetical protein
MLVDDGQVQRPKSSPSPASANSSSNAGLLISHISKPCYLCDPSICKARQPANQAQEEWPASQSTWSSSQAATLCHLLGVAWPSYSLAYPSDLLVRSQREQALLRAKLFPAPVAQLPSVPVVCRGAAHNHNLNPTRQ